MQTQEIMPVIDYSHHNYWKDHMIVQGKDDNVLALSKLDRPFKRGDGKKAHYELEHRWLSQPCEDGDDDNYVCVKGSDLTYWTQAEMQNLMKKFQKKEPVNLFDRFKLFG